MFVDWTKQVRRSGLVICSLNASQYWLVAEAIGSLIFSNCESVVDRFKSIERPSLNKLLYNHLPAIKA
jgi:hypothetical protein